MGTSYGAKLGFGDLEIQVDLTLLGSLEALALKFSPCVRDGGIQHLP